LSEYREPRVEFEIKIRIRGINGELCHRHAVLHAFQVVEAFQRRQNDGTSRRGDISAPVPRGTSKPQQEPVLVDVLEFSEGPQGAFVGHVRSIVWLMSPNDLQLSRVETVEPVPRLGLSEVVRIGADGESQYFGDLIRDRLILFPEMGFSQAVNEVVKSRPQVVKTVTRIEAQELQESFSDDRVIEVLCSLAIGLSADSIMTSTHGVIDCRVEIVEVGLRPIKTTVDGDEISHDLAAERDEQEIPNHRLTSYAATEDDA
jgi:hypothetical protein